ncbi:MAG: hypothetical protein ACHQ03_08935, partial [Candidatus Bathyarchaeia archaeon]
MSTASKSKKPLAAVVVIVIIVIAGIGVYFMTQQPSSSSSTMSTSAMATAPTTLTIDDAFWPSGDLNQLSALGEIPYPNWAANTVYQPLTTLNGSLLYQNG